MKSDFQICKEWFSHCDKVKHTNINTANIENIGSKITNWKTRQLLPKNQASGLISNETIIDAAKECGFKVGYKTFKDIENYYERDPYCNWRSIRKTKVKEVKKLHCFNISSCSVQFRPHLHNDEKQIDYYHHYNNKIDAIHLLHNIMIQHRYGGSPLIFSMIDKETGDVFNGYTRDEMIHLSDRLHMFGIRTFQENKTESSWISLGDNTRYLDILNRIVQNCEDFILECEEATLLKI
jgi:hypothetical protein